MYRVSIVAWVIVCVFALWYKMYWSISDKVETSITYSFDVIDFNLTTAHLIMLNELSQEENDEPCYPISDEDRWVIECIVAGESKYEPLLGKMAVAQCILNAMKQDELTASEVRNVYQYSGWDSNLESKDPEEWAEVCHAVWCVFDNGEVVTQENILWFYNPNRAQGKFHNTQEFVLEIGNHRFYAPWEEE